MSKLSRGTIPTHCAHCGAPLPPPEEQAHRPGSVSKYCTPRREKRPNGTTKRIPSACERERAAIRKVLSIDPATLTPSAAETLAKKLVALAQRTREEHLLPGSKRLAKMSAG